MKASLVASQLKSSSYLEEVKDELSDWLVWIGAELNEARNKDELEFRLTALELMSTKFNQI